MGLLKILGIGKYLKKVKAYVDSHVSEKIAEVVANAPDDLDTLKEIADYIASDKTGAAEINNKIAAHDNAITELGNQAEELGKTLEEGREAIANLEDNKVDKEDGKGLSTEDYTTADKAKLAGLQNYDDSGVKASISSLTEATNENKSAIDVLEENKADRDGYYPNLRVGLSDNLPDRGDVLEGVLGFRESAGEGNSIEDGTAEIKELMGESLVWNQLMPKGESIIHRGITFTVNEDGSIVANGTATTDTIAYIALRKNYETLSSHKYFVLGTPKGGSINTYFFGNGVNLNDPTGSGRIASGEGATNTYACRVVSGVTVENVVFRPMFIDLTQMFGVGNEPTTVEEFEAIKNQLVGVDMYAYNEGEVIGVNPTGIKSVNDNAFNGEYARVLGGKEYCIDGSVTSIGFTKELGGTTEAITLDLENKYTPSENGYIYASGSDICIHLVHTGYKGHDYVAHEEDTMPLDLTPYFPNGMHGINGVRDSVTKDKATRRIGVVDMGTMSWSQGTNDTTIFLTSFKASPAISIDTEIAAILCNKYDTVSRELLREKSMCMNTMNYILVKDSSYTDAASFKAAMSGVMLYYELAEPIETEIGPQLNLSYKVWDFGTEELLSDKMSCPAIVKALYGFNATDTIRGNKAKNNEQDERLEVLEKEVVRNDDYAPAVTVGFADNLVSNDVVVESEFSLRQSGDGAILGGSARIEEVQGNSVVWNQQIKYALDQDGSGANGWWSRYTGAGMPTLVNNTVTAFAPEGYTPFLAQKVSVVNGHKYLIDFDFEASYYDKYNRAYYVAFSEDAYGNGTPQGGYAPQDGLTKGHATRFVTATSDYNYIIFRLSQLLDSVPEDSASISNFSLYDLTLMFGSGNEPTTIEEFYARIPQGVDRYAYNEGEVIHSKVDAVKSIGRNVWDEEWEVDTIGSDGNTIDSNDTIRSRNFSPILGNTKYYFLNTNNLGYTIVVYFYDKDFKMIPYTGTGAWGNGYNGGNGEFITPDGASYFKLRTVSTYGPTYKNDICINLSDPDFNGQYEPYREDVRELPSVLKEVFPEGMMSAGTAHDVAYNDLNKEVGVTEKRIGVVDMGTLNWNYTPVSDTYPYGYIATNSVPRVFGTRNILCSKYSVKPDYTKDKVIYGISSTKGVIVVDSAYTDVASFKAAMSGVMLYYELAEPEVQEHELFNLDYEARNGGQEEAITSEISTPLKAKIAYGFNAAAKIKENAQSIAEIESEISDYTLATEADIDSIFTE